MDASGHHVSLSHARCTAVQHAGFTPMDLGIARDSHSGLKSALDAALAQAHVLITSGGVSMGACLAPAIPGALVHF